MLPSVPAADQVEDPTDMLGSEERRQILKRIAELLSLLSRNKDVTIDLKSFRDLHPRERVEFCSFCETSRISPH